MTDVIEKALKETLDKIVKDRQYEDYTFEITPISSGGANYSSRLYAGKILVPNQTDIKWFAKIAVCSEKFRAEIQADVYKIEQYAYSQLLRLFQDIEYQYGVPEDLRLAVPTLYGFLELPPTEVIVLEDLAAQGFSTHDRLKAYDWEYASSCVQQIAEFHALSFSLPQTHPQEYKKTVDILKLGIIDIIEPLTKIVKGSIERTLNLLKEENRGRVEKYIGDLGTVLLNMYAPCRRPVIAHGDFRMSNILHKIDANGKIKLFIVDYQTLHIGSAVNDLLYFIATGSDAKFRKLHYQQLLDYYYEQLSLALARLRLDVDQLFPRQDFDYELKENVINLLLYALYTLPVVTVDEKDAPELDEELEIDKIMNVKVSDLGVERLNDLVEDFIEWGLM